MSKHITKASKSKPRKPYSDFPLFPHAAGVWAKKIRGKLHYFGPWSDPDAALQKYVDQRDDLRAGRIPRVANDGLLVRDLLDRFLSSKQALVNSGEILPRTFKEYHHTCKRIGDAFGLTRLVDDLAADDFDKLRAEMVKHWGPVRLANEIQRVRMVFKYAYEASLIDQPVRYGPNFKKPSNKVLRKERAKRGRRVFERQELLTVIDAANPTLEAMIILGINCGYGNTDVATLPLAAIDLGSGWIDYPRPKTGVPRRCPLWPETVKAIRQAKATRPEPSVKADSDLLFITPSGKTFAGEYAHRRVAGEMAKLLRRAQADRPGLSFYAIRHTFQTVGDGARDPVAVQAIMGHAPSQNDMSAVYREGVDDERLKAVTDHVHQWLFGDDPDPEAETD